MKTTTKQFFTVLSVFTLLLTLSVGKVMAAKAEDLHGRWRLMSENPSLEFATLQFEKNGRLFLEELNEGEQGKVYTVRAVEYSVEEDKLLLPDFIFDEPVPFAFDGGQLVFSIEGEDAVIFEEEKELRRYSSIAQDAEMRIMQIEALDLNVEIFGDRAITHVMYTIKNNFDEDVEAKIEIPLPEDALVVGYALDIKGAMIEGVAVPKEKARQAFEEIEDREVDPGIAEITRGNKFSTEIYPVPSNGTRKVRVSYTHSLDRNLIGLYSYEYPFSHVDSHAAVTITMSADGMRFIPLVKKSPFAKPKWDEASTGTRFYFAEALPYSYKRTGVLEDLSIRFTPLDDSSAVIAHAQDGNRYVFAKLLVNDEQLVSLEKHQRISVLWDASSSAQANHKENLKLLAAFLKNVKKLKLENVELQLIIFANDVLHQKVYTLVDKQDALVLQHLIGLDYDGATRFDAAEQVAREFKADYALLFSDGISSLGSLAPIDIGKPLYVIAGSGELDLPWLYAAAYKNRGLLLHLDKLGQGRTLELIARQLPEIDIRLNGELKKLDVATWVSINKDTSISVAAQLPEDLKELQDGTLSFSAGKELLYVAPFEQRAAGEFARYDWLRLRLNNLLGDLVNNEKLITELGMGFSLATPFTSLMVLEDMDDYVAYGIRPPADFPNAKSYEELRADYLEDEDKEVSKEEIITYLESAWKTRTDWWKNSKKINLDEIEKQLQYETKKVNTENVGAMPDAPVAEALQRVSGVAVDEGEVEEIMVNGIRSSALDGPVASTSITPWSPDTPYLERIKAGDPKGKKSVLDIYYEEKEVYGSSPTFYMDVAQYFFDVNADATAIRIMSNVLESNPENVALERMVAYNLEQFKEFDAAIAVLEHVKKLNPWEASSARDLAKVWEKKALASGAATDYQKAIDYYVEAITGPWELEEELRIVALMEFNHLLAKLKSESMHVPEWKAALLKDLDLDVRIVLSWNSRVADIDLWVKEPSGEFVSYKDPQSLAGGYLPFDITDGFGPEEYLTCYALKGEYEVFVDLYSNRSVELFGPITLTLDIYTNYGKENETLSTTTVRLKEKGERIPVGSIEWN